MLPSKLFGYVTVKAIYCIAIGLNAIVQFANAGGRRQNHQRRLWCGGLQCRLPGQAHEFAAKVAETDATKQALSTFGNAFGQSL